MRLEATITRAVEAALTKGPRTRAFYEALCLLAEDVEQAVADGNADRMEAALMSGGAAGLAAALGGDEL